MRVLIRNPAPDDPEDQVYWGDTFFGRSLARCLEAEGCDVSMQYWPSWQGDGGADLLLVLRGLRKVDAIEGDFSRTAIWIISHPEDVADEELALFDLVLCASASHCEALRGRGHNAHEFLQCTDEAVFFPRPRERSQLENAFIFVGNARAERKIVHDAIAADLPLKIWGRGWNRHNYDRCVVRPFIHNAELGELYRGSLCTLNDHWSDMARFDYVNNRVFDALACGLPVLSDSHPGLEALDFGGVQFRREGQSIDEAVDMLLAHYDRLQDAAYCDAEFIRTEHTFACRARKLREIVA
jgi:spore maturation protein CgeB